MRKYWLNFLRGKNPEIKLNSIRYCKDKYTYLCFLTTVKMYRIGIGLSKDRRVDMFKCQNRIRVGMLS